jgi:hypothetical protein
MPPRGSRRSLDGADGADPVYSVMHPGVKTKYGTVYGTLCHPPLPPFTPFSQGPFTPFQLTPTETGPSSLQLRGFCLLCTEELRGGLYAACRYSA